jgi:hypothetical protein
VDANQAEIADAFRRLGWDVIDTHQCAQYVPGFPDLIAIRDRVVLPIEVKGKRGRLTVDELAFAMAHPEWEPIVVRTVDDVIWLTGEAE